METLTTKLRELLPKISKAIAGGLVTGTVVLLLKYNVDVPLETQSALNVVLDFVIGQILGTAVVYLAPKNKEN